MLAEAERQEIITIVNKEINAFMIRDAESLKIHQQQWKKFKESPEARLASLETKVDAFIYETRISFEKVDQRFEKVDQRFEKFDQRFEEMNHRFDKVYERLNTISDLINAQVWKFFLSLSFLALALKLIDKLWP
jgi:predicted RNase H-like nuclease (RuvC/YqgF family)